MRWNVDLAATGVRHRLFIGIWQLIAYEDGRWEVRHDNEVVDTGTRGGKPAAYLSWMMAMVKLRTIA